MAPEWIDQAVQELLKAKQSGKGIAPLTESYPEITLKDAYEISKRVLAKRLALGGDQRVGTKIGLTSEVVQKQLGVAEPDFGFLTQKMHLKSPASFETKGTLQPRAEAEVAFLLNETLDEGDIDFARVMNATEALIPCIEIIDSRVLDWKIKIEDTVADNASSLAFVTGTPLELNDKNRNAVFESLPERSMQLLKNDQIASEGKGAACLGHPANAVIWLAKKMKEQGAPLKKGEIVLSGAFGPVIPILNGDQIEARIEGSILFFVK